MRLERRATGHFSALSGDLDATDGVAKDCTRHGSNEFVMKSAAALGVSADPHADRDFMSPIDTDATQKRIVGNS
jgi:hypothetical protein